MAYALPADLIARQDARVLGDLCQDANVRVTPSGLVSDPNVLAALASASGTINAAAAVGGRYTGAELQSLTGDDKAFLTKLCCDIGFGLLQQRRGTDISKLLPYMEAQKTLEMLRSGTMMFAVPADIAAGVPSSQFPSSTSYAQLNLIRDAAGRMFAPRRQQTEVSS